VNGMDPRIAHPTTRVGHNGANGVIAGGGQERVELDSIEIPTMDDGLIQEVHQALDELAKVDSEKAEIVKLRFFGGNFSLTGGFWSLLAVVPTPGAPKLTITLLGANTAKVSWPSPSTGF